MRLCREVTGAVDIVSHIRPLDTLKVAESPYAKVVKSRDVTYLGCCINQRKTRSKWRDIRLRKALNYAVNREELRKYGAKGNAYNLGGFIPPGAFGYDPNLTLYTYDTEKARALLADAGYPNGFEVKIITFEALRVEARGISRMLERIGLKPHLEILTYYGWLERVYVPLLRKPPEEEDWDISIHWGWDWAGNTGASLVGAGLIGNDFNWTEYDPVYEEMWKDMAATMDPKDQEKKIRQLAQYVYDHAYFIFAYSPLMLYAINKEVDFVPQKNQFMRLKETSVTENHWSLRGMNN
jgi:peptide/nickel transport system substrate-binding protein